MLHVPPLRERLSDLPELLDHLLSVTCTQLGVRPKRLDPEALRILMTYDWMKNNVRELRNVVERMVLAADGEEIGPEHVPAEMRGGALLPQGDARAKTFRDLKAEAERQILVLALQRNDWHITRTARDLGLADHSSLLKIMRRHNLSRD